MDIRVRLASIGVVAGLIIAKAIEPAFLGSRLWNPLPFTWFWLVLFVAMWIMAWLLTPPFMAGMNWMAKRAFLPATFFVLILVGGLWGLDALWNEGVRSFCDSCGEWHLLASFTAAMFGGPP